MEGLGFREPRSADRKETDVYDWEINEESDGTIVALLCRTRVRVARAEGDAEGRWRWEVRFADGQTQSGLSEDREAALEKGKRVAERYMP